MSWNKSSQIHEVMIRFAGAPTLHSFPLCSLRLEWESTPPLSTAVIPSSLTERAMTAVVLCRYPRPLAPNQRFTLCGYCSAPAHNRSMRADFCVLNCYGVTTPQQSYDDHVEDIRLFVRNYLDDQSYFELITVSAGFFQIGNGR